MHAYIDTNTLGGTEFADMNSRGPISEGSLYVWFRPHGHDHSFALTSVVFSWFQVVAWICACLQNSG